MVREVVLSKYETRLQSLPIIFPNHVTTWDVSKFFHWQLDNPHRNRLELRIPCLYTMVYVGYCLFSSYGMPTSTKEVV